MRWIYKIHIGGTIFIQHHMRWSQWIAFEDWIHYLWKVGGTDGKIKLSVFFSQLHKGYLCTLWPIYKLTYNLKMDKPISRLL